MHTLKPRRRRWKFSVAVLSNNSQTNKLLKSVMNILLKEFEECNG